MNKEQIATVFRKQFGVVTAYNYADKPTKNIPRSLILLSTNMRRECFGSTFGSKVVCKQVYSIQATVTIGPNVKYYAPYRLGLRSIDRNNTFVMLVC